jgi:orotate phosphoribosyltransferase
MTLHRAKPLSKFEANPLREKVHRIIKEKSFAEGDFVLVSGRRSKYYLDMKPTLFSPEGATAVAELVLNELAGTRVDYIGGLAVGAIPLASAVAIVSERHECPLPGFFVRSAVKDHGTKKLIEGLAAGETLSGKRVVIVDDVTTQGTSAMTAVEAARGAGAEVALVLSIVDREEGAEDFFRAQAIPFRWLFRASEFLSAARTDAGS